MYLSVPFNMLLIGIRFPFFPDNKNPFTVKNRYNSGVKRGAFAKEYSVVDIKRKCKEHKVTFNDLIMTAISMTVKQYFIKKGDEKTNRILVTMPVSFREKQKTALEFDFVNNVSVIPLPLSLVNEFDNGV